MIRQLSAEFSECLRDESRRTGTADTISFPTSEAEVAEIIKEIRAQGGKITVQGARTGIVAGAVPEGGHVMNLSRMKAIGEIRQEGGRHLITVEPGVLLTEIRDAIHPHSLFFPPDPTETSASIGGMAASNASGAMSFFYGPTRKWVSAIRGVLSDGSIISVRRGQCVARGRSFSLTTEDGRAISGELPSYNPPQVKSAAGYFVADDVDLVDVLVGMEGTLCVITQMELSLTPVPGAVNGLTVFLSEEEAALKLVRVLRGEDVEGFEPLSVRPVAIEFFNHDALDLLRDMKQKYSAFEKIPALKPHFHTAINTEFHAESDEELEEVVMQLMDILAELGASDEDTWFATTEREMEPLKAFRHATPEAVNLLIDERRRESPGISKLGTDMSVPDEHLEAVLGMYNSDLEQSGLESVVFGHIGNNHVHVNILPHTPEEYDRGKSLYMNWAQRVVEMGGSVSAEHGIGKLKAPFLKIMYTPEQIEQMRQLKSLFDPEMMLNPGNLF